MEKFTTWQSKAEATAATTAGFTSKYNSKIRDALKDLELQADLVHETTSGAQCGKQWAPIQVLICQEFKTELIKGKEMGTFGASFFQSLWESLVQTLGSLVTKRLF